MENHECEGSAQEPMDREQAMAAGGEVLISGWLDGMLTDSLAFADDETDEERAYKIAAAREALRQLAPEGAGLAERMQAVQYLCAFQAGQFALAEANSPYLPPEQRVAARRFARQAMALTNSQLRLLTRLGRERDLERQAVRFRGERVEAARQRGESPPHQGLAGKTERMTEAGEKPANGAAAPGPSPAVPESRQRRRARERQERKAERRLKGAA